MDFKLKAPCGNCPFRTDKPNQQGWLGKERAKEIYEAIRNDKTFTCHKTIDNDEQFCAGALILLEHEGVAIQNNAIRMAERFRMYNHTEMKMDSPVFKTGLEFIKWHNKKASR